MLSVVMMSPLPNSFPLLCTAELIVSLLIIATEAVCGACQAFLESRRAVRCTGGGHYSLGGCGASPHSPSGSAASWLCDLGHTENQAVITVSVGKGVVKS